MGEYEYRPYRRGDAEALARLFNESEEGWPGGFTGGVKLTGRYVEEWIGNMDNILVLVAWRDGHAVGFIQMSRHWADPQAGYINLLNVHPEHRGRGIGTRLLVSALKKAVEEGLLRVDLHTWGGNEGALRLYKKLGFKWVPGTRVYMQNYLPSLARLPGLRGLLDSEELFSFRKNLEPVEDGVVLDGHRVFLYDWGGGRRLVADYRSWRVTGASWPGVEVLVSAPERIVRGFPYRAGVKVAGVSVKPWGNGVKVWKEDDVIKFLVEPGVRPRSEDEPGRSAGVYVPEWDIVFASGFKDYEPLVLDEVYPTPLRRSNSRVEVSLTNLGGEGLGVQVYAGAPLIKNLGEGEGLTVNLPANPAPPSWRHVLYYKASLGGVERAFSLSVSAPVVEPGVVGYAVDEGKGVIEVATEDYRAKVYLRGGRVILYDREGIIAADLQESIGPPTWPNVVERKTFDYRLKWSGSELVIILSAYLPSRNVFLEKHIVFRAAPPEITVHYTLGGHGEKILEIWSYGTHYLDDRLWVPLREGVVEIDVLPGETLASRYALPVEPEAYRASWSYRRRVDGLGIATMWSSRGLVQVDFGWGRLPSLKYRLNLDVGRATVDYRVVLGVESWREAERLCGAGETGDKESKVSRELEPAVEPPLLSTMDRAVELVIKTWRRRRTEGVLRASSKELGFSLEEGFTLEEVGSEHRMTIPLPPGRGIGTHSISVEVDSTHGVLSKTLSLVTLWNPGERVRVREGSVDNGYLTLRADPGYAGVLYAVEIEGVNNLYTPYPERGVLDWINPWFGGMQLELGRARLWEEKWEMKAVRMGLFSGLELSTKLEDKLGRRLRGLVVRHQYLTLPGSNMVYSRIILENQTGRIVSAPPSLQVFAKPGGTLAESFQLDRGDGKLVWHRHEGSFDEPYKVSRQGFAVAYSRRGAVAVIPLSADWLVAVVCYGEKGCHFWLEPSTKKSLRPGEERVYESAVVFARGREASWVEGYSVLREVWSRESSRLLGLHER